MRLAVVYAKYWPLFWASLVTIGYIAVFRNTALPKTIYNVFNAVVSIAGIAIAFLLTVKSILISIDDKDVIVFLKNGGHYATIIQFIKAAMLWWLGLIVATCAALLFDCESCAKNWEESYGWYFGVWIFFAVGSVASYIRISNLFFKILARLSTRTKPSRPTGSPAIDPDAS